MATEPLRPRTTPIVALVLALTAACSTGGGTYRHASVLGSPTGRMVASWYGAGFQGRRTASGKTFDSGAFTCAHRELPFGTVLRLRNPATGASVDVTVTDRGPFVRGRDLDVSRAAARRLGFESAGTAELAVEILARGAPLRASPRTSYGVLGAGL